MHPPDESPFQRAARDLREFRGRTLVYIAIAATTAAASAASAQFRPGPLTMLPQWLAGAAGGFAVLLMSLGLFHLAFLVRAPFHLIADARRERDALRKQIDGDPIEASIRYLGSSEVAFGPARLNALELLRDLAIDLTPGCSEHVVAHAGERRLRLAMPQEQFDALSLTLRRRWVSAVAMHWRTAGAVDAESTQEQHWSGNHVFNVTYYKLSDFGALMLLRISSSTASPQARRASSDGQ